MDRKVNLTIIFVILMMLVFTSCGASRYSKQCGCPPNRGIVG